MGRKVEEKEEEVVLANVSSGCLGRRKRIWMGGIRRTLRLSQAAGDGWRKSTWLYVECVSCLHKCSEKQEEGGTSSKI